MKNLKRLFKISCVLFLTSALSISFFIAQPITLVVEAKTVILDPISRSGDASEGSNMNVTTVAKSIIPDNTFMESYFKNLDNNFPENPTKFCVYSSFTMILSYYDTWLNNTIIAEDYEAMGSIANENSPGVDSNNCTELSDFMVDLIINVTNQSVENIYNSGVDDSNILHCLDGGLNWLQIRDYFEIKSYSSEINLDSLISDLENNCPILAGYSIGVGQNHAVVIFAYNEEEDVFYAHNGYQDNLFVAIPSDQLMYAYILQPLEFFEHQCSDNYTDRGCPCDLVYHPAHEEEHHNLMITEAGHTEICDVNCGLEAELEAHIFERTPGYVEAGHNVTCVTCGYITTEPHYFIVGEHIDEYTHYVYCECGYDGVGYHWDFPPEIFGAGYQHYLACSICEYSWIEDHFPYYYEDCGDGTYRIWCYCGYPLYFTDIFPSDLEELPYE